MTDELQALLDRAKLMAGIFRHLSSHGESTRADNIDALAAHVIRLTVERDALVQANAALMVRVGAADRLAECMLTTRDYVDDASKSLLLYRGRSVLTEMTTDDLALIDAAIAALSDAWFAALRAIAAYQSAKDKTC